MGYSCPLAWRLCPAQEADDVALMVKQGFEPDNSDGKLLCLMVDVHDTDGREQGGGIWWRVAGHPELESCLLCWPVDPHHEVRFVEDRERVFHGKELGDALKSLAEAKVAEINERRFVLINKELEAELGPAEKEELKRLQKEVDKYVDLVAPLLRISGEGA